MVSLQVELDISSLGACFTRELFCRLFKSHMRDPFMCSLHLSIYFLSFPDDLTSCRLVPLTVVVLSVVEYLSTCSQFYGASISDNFALVNCELVMSTNDFFRMISQPVARFLWLSLIYPLLYT